MDTAEADFVLAELALAAEIADLLDAGEPRSAGPRVSRISLANIRCFRSFELTFSSSRGEPALFSMILGDNAAGKSTLLRCIALGLSSESEASSLIKQLPGSFVRLGAEEGSIRLDLYNPESGQELAVTTRIYKNGSTDERIRKETHPEPFPWQDIFVCAYGTNRSRQAAASYETYTLHQAVLSLFDDDSVLQNPEVVLLRQDPRLRKELKRRLLRILMLQRLRESLEASLRTGESEAEREVEQAVDAALRERVTKVKPELLDLEARRPRSSRHEDLATLAR